TSIHHNVFANVGYQRVYYPICGVRASAGSFYNNTVDAGGTKLGWFDNPFVALMGGTNKLTSLRNNIFTGFAYQRSYPVVDSATVSSADYNCFYNPDTTTLTHYGDS